MSKLALDPDIEKVKGLLNMLLMDFTHQIDSLEENEDTSWDVLDVDNWTSMADSIIETGKLLGFELSLEQARKEIELNQD